MRTTWVSMLGVAGILSGCAVDVAPASPDGRDEVGLSAGKADGSDFDDCELEAVVHWVNDPATDAGTLKDAGVHGRAAANIIDHRNGPDGMFGTADDQLFEDIVQIDDVYYVGPAAIRQLVAAVEDRCVDPGLGSIEVVFSPQPYFRSHLVRTANLIDDAQRSVDVAMYSFGDHGILESLRRARERGVSIRVLFDTASQHRSDPEGTLSATLEDMGIEVRWINKIMHHKLAIIDGVRTDADDPMDGVLVTGSGNWSHSAGTKYEENTLFVRRNPELLLRFQREFNHLWEHSRELEWNESIEYFESVPIAEDSIAGSDDPAVDAVFTSANFRTYLSSRYGHTFSARRGERHVAERMVEIIESAERSIHVASGHLRSRLIAEALLRKAEESPSIDIRVYLDGQEWISQWYHDQQMRELDGCLAEAVTDNDVEDCMYGGLYFSYEMHRRGVPIRFKYYSYRWDYHYAEQMHHKFFVVDGRMLVTGSYNWSDNAETNTMENVVIVDGERYPDLVQAYEAEFERMWVTGEGLYDPMLEEIRNGTGDVDIVFEPMSLDWAQIDGLKDAIRAACPDVDTAEYRNDPPAHRTCDRG